MSHRQQLLQVLAGQRKEKNDENGNQGQGPDSGDQKAIADVIERPAPSELQESDESAQELASQEKLVDAERSLAEPLHRTEDVGAERAAQYDATGSTEGSGGKAKAMNGALCTFSGKYGDILWSLPTARYISEKIAMRPVDFCVMPYYRNLLPLLASQSYIEHAFVREDWLRTHSNHGDQPWEPPADIKFKPWAKEVPEAEGEYERLWHLTYRGHPGISAPNMPLIDFVAFQQGISFNGWTPCPFIEIDESVEEEANKLQFATASMAEVIKEKRLVTYSFNEQYAEPKKEFFETLWRIANPEGFEFFDVSSVGWKEAAWLIQKSLVYVGCRAACWVVANGVGKEIISFEPHPSRHRDCHLGQVFGNPYGKEIALPFGMPPETAADAAAAMLRKMRADNVG